MFGICMLFLLPLIPDLQPVTSISNMISNSPSYKLTLYKGTLLPIGYFAIIISKNKIVKFESHSYSGCALMRMCTACKDITLVGININEKIINTLKSMKKIDILKYDKIISTHTIHSGHLCVARIVILNHVNIDDNILKIINIHRQSDKIYFENCSFQSIRALSHSLSANGIIVFKGRFTDSTKICNMLRNIQSAASMHFTNIDIVGNDFYGMDDIDNLKYIKFDSCRIKGSISSICKNKNIIFIHSYSTNIVNDDIIKIKERGISIRILD